MPLEREVVGHILRDESLKLTSTYRFTHFSRPITLSVSKCCFCLAHRLETLFRSKENK